MPKKGNKKETKPNEPVDNPQVNGGDANNQKKNNDEKKLKVSDLKSCYFFLNPSTSHAWGRDGTKIFLVENNPSIEINPANISDELLEIMLKECKSNILYIGNKAGNDITHKYVKEYKPVKKHEFKDPRSVTHDPRIANLIFLLNPSISDSLFIENVSTATEDQIKALLNILESPYFEKDETIGTKKTILNNRLNALRTAD